MQNASLLYFQRNIYMTCVMASNSKARGCRFILAIGNRTETFDLLLGEGGGALSQCNQTMNLGKVYDTVSVVDILDTGNNGPLPLIVQAQGEADESVYKMTTSCAIPGQDTARMST